MASSVNPTVMEVPVDKRLALKEWLASGKAVLQPLTFPQRELWETSPIPISDTANHICCLIRVRGVLTPEACEAALRRVVERQEVLRLSILPGKERPVQMIRQSAEPNFRYRALATGQTRDEAVEEIAREIFSKPFDLVRGPLYRVEILRRGPDDHVMVFAIHHAVADGWTLGVFVRDLCAGYLQGIVSPGERLPELPLTYSAWGAVERAFWQQPELERRAAFWRSALSESPRLWSASEGALTASGAPMRWVVYFPSSVVDAAQELARATGVTLFSTLLAAFQVAFSQWTGQTDILVGTPVANRSKQTVRDTMGYFAGIVPLRGQIEPDRPFSDSLKIAQQKTADSFTNAMPFAELTAVMGETRAPGHNPIFEVRFALQNHPVPSVALHGLSASLEMRSTGTARFHLGCEITVVKQGLEVVWLFRPDLFSLADIENLVNLFRAVLDAVCRSPESRINSLVGKN